MTGEEEGVFLYELYLKMYRIDVLEMMDPLSPSNKMANNVLDQCDDEMLMAIYRAKVPWLAARALGRVMERRQAEHRRKSRE